VRRAGIKNIKYKITQERNLFSINIYAVAEFPKWGDPLDRAKKKKLPFFKAASFQKPD
jgi:hypothetical protein